MSVELLKVKTCAKTRKGLKIFETDSETEGRGKLEKFMEIVVESYGIWTPQKNMNPATLANMPVSNL